MDHVEAERRLSRRDRVLSYFKAHAGIWLTTYELEREGGRQAWRTRVSDARKAIEADGGVIQNKLRKRSDGSVESLYRYLPQKPLGPDSTQFRQPRLV